MCCSTWCKCENLNAAFMRTFFIWGWRTALCCCCCTIPLTARLCQLCCNVAIVLAHACSVCSIIYTYISRYSIGGRLERMASVLTESDGALFDRELAIPSAWRARSYLKWTTHAFVVRLQRIGNRVSTQRRRNMLLMSARARAQHAKLYRMLNTTTFVAYWSNLRLYPLV